MATDAHAEAVERAARVFNNASDLFDELSAWEQVGTETVRRLGLRPGDKVVDLCAGTGASALPAARAVAPTGTVQAVDLAERMLARAREKAEAAGLRNLETVVADATRTGLAGAAYDVTICVFGVFFVPDMAAFVSEMWRLVRPGGRVAITNWGEVVFQPGDRLFKAALAAEAPEHAPPPGKPPPWARISTPAGMAALFAEAGATEPAIELDSIVEVVRTPEDAWTAVLGSGSRGVVDALDPERRERVHRHLVAATETEGVTEIRSDVIYAVATKPANG